MTLDERVRARNLAQKSVEEGVAETFTIGRTVEISGLRGPQKGIVIGTEAEIVLVKNANGTVLRRHFDKVS